MRSLPWLKRRAPQQEGEKQKLEGGTRDPVLPEGRRDGHVAGGMEPRVYVGP